MINGDEECDDGDANADSAACTTLCTAAVCGDGFVQDGVEACDDGDDDESNECTTLCAAPACDDGIVSGDESDLDCGGSCAGCELDGVCNESGDCGSNLCLDNVCALPRDCKELADQQLGLEDGNYVIDFDGPGGNDALEVYCDMTTDGGGWTRCGVIDETDLGNDVCVIEADIYTEADLLLNDSFCALMFAEVPTAGMLIHNKTPDGDQDFGFDDKVRITWDDSPMTLGTYDNHPIADCRELTTDTVFADCQYSSHGGNPWQTATWSFTRGLLNNGYSGNANRRVILGPSFAPGTNGCTWHNFGAETNARNIANTWRLTENIGDMFLR